MTDIAHEPPPGGSGRAALVERSRWARDVAGYAATLPREGFIAQMDRLAAAGFNTWWLSPQPGEVLSGPYTEAGARERYDRDAWPGIQVWRGADDIQVQPANPAWVPAGQPRAEHDVQALGNAELADQLGALPGMRPRYRAAVLAEAAVRLRAGGRRQ